MNHSFLSASQAWHVVTSPCLGELCNSALIGTRFELNVDASRYKQQGVLFTTLLFKLLIGGGTQTFCLKIDLRHNDNLKEGCCIVL